MKYLIFVFFMAFNVLAIEHKTEQRLKTVFEKYEVVHTHFFEYNDEKAKKAIKDLSEAISKIEEEEVKKRLVYSKKTLDKMADIRDSSELNKKLNTVSMALIYILDKYNVDKKYQSYYCPMVKKKWIQNTSVESKVLNPYAPEMPHCGAKE